MLSFAQPWRSISPRSIQLSICYALIAAALIGQFSASTRGAMPTPASAPAAPVLSDWLNFVPGDARLYVELRDLAGMRKTFQRLGIWDALRRMEGDTSAPAQALPADPGTSSGFTSESAIKVSVHRLRKRFQRVLRDEIAHTVSADSEIEDELKYLMAALRK